METNENIEKVDKILEMFNSVAFETDEQKLKLFELLDDDQGLIEKLLKI